MESRTAKKKFCSALHRVYWNRENNKKLEVIIKDATNNGYKEKLDTVVKNKFLSPLDNSPEVIPPMPVRNPGEDALDFAVRKNEWKQKYGL